MMKIDSKNINRVSLAPINDQENDIRSFDWPLNELHQGTPWLASQPVIHNNSFLRVTLDSLGSFNLSTLEKPSSNSSNMSVTDHFLGNDNASTVNYPLVAYWHPQK